MRVGLERVERRLAALEDLADQRIAVGVRPARGEAEQRIAGRYRAPIEDALLLHHADAEPGEVVFAFRIHAGHLGGLAADQRAAGHARSRGNALDHVLADLQSRACRTRNSRERTAARRPARGRRSTLIATRSMPTVSWRVEGERELELGADAVGARDQHRLLVLLRDLAQRAEAADARRALRAAACAGQSGLIASTSASPASMSTPASR